MFGFMIVRKEKLCKLESRVEDLISHVFENAGFVDEKGVLSNNPNGPTNEARLKHWSVFHRMTKDISNLFRALIMLLCIVCPSVSMAKSIKVTDANSVVLDGPTTVFTMERLEREVLKKGYKNKHIYIIVRSQGGDVLATEDFIQTVKETGLQVDTITVMAAGSAFNLVQALGTRYMAPKGVMAVIKPAASFIDGDAFTITELNNRMNRMVKIVDQVNSRSAKRMGITSEKFREQSRDELWLDSAGAIQHNAIDQVLTSVEGL